MKRTRKGQEWHRTSINIGMETYERSQQAQYEEINWSKELNQAMNDIMDRCDGTPTVLERLNKLEKQLKRKVA